MTYIEVEAGIKLAVDDINSNGKATIVMIHGWPLSQKIFEYQKVILIKLGFRVVTFDIRGFGLSDTSAKGYTYMDLASDLYRVVTCLGLSNFILAGFSMGGAIAIRYMSIYNGYGVKKLVLMATAAPWFIKKQDYLYGITNEKLNEIIVGAYKDKPHMVVEFIDNFFALPHSDEMKEWLKNICYDASSIGIIETATTLREEDLETDLYSIHVPTAIFHGKKDLICPYELAETMNQCIEGSELITFDNCGHGIFCDNLDEFNRKLIAFIN